MPVQEIQSSFFPPQFGNKVGEGAFRGKALPTYVYPKCIKNVIWYIITGGLQDYPNPQTPAVTGFVFMSITIFYSLNAQSDPCKYNIFKLVSVTS